MQCCNIWWNYINCETILQQLLEHLQTSVVSTVFASYLCQTVMQNSNACATEHQETMKRHHYISTLYYKYKLLVWFRPTGYFIYYTVWKQSPVAHGIGGSWGQAQYHLVTSLWNCVTVQSFPQTTPCPLKGVNRWRTINRKKWLLILATLSNSVVLEKKCAEVFIFYVVCFTFEYIILKYASLFFTHKHGGCMNGSIRWPHWVFNALQN